MLSYTYIVVFFKDYIHVLLPQYCHYCRGRIIINENKGIIHNVAKNKAHLCSYTEEWTVENQILVSSVQVITVELYYNVMTGAEYFVSL
jgi:hypothetical protein